MNYGLFKALNSVLVLDDLDGIALSFSAWYELEGGFLTEVLELLARSPAHVHLLDFVGVELVGCACTLAGKFHMEAPKVAENHLVASEHLFADAGRSLLEDGCHVALIVGTTVVGNVLGELLEVEHLMYLCRTVSLCLRNVFLLRARLGRSDVNTIVYHNSPLPSSSKGGGVLYTAEGIAGVKG